MTEEQGTISFAVEQRLRMIDLLLAHYGYFNRATIADCFGISMPAVTRDIRLYRHIAPNNVRFSETEKRYFSTAKFQRVWQ